MTFWNCRYGKDASVLGTIAAPISAEAFSPKKKSAVFSEQNEERKGEENGSSAFIV